MRGQNALFGATGATGATGSTGATGVIAAGSFSSSSPGTSVASNTLDPLTTAGPANTPGAFTLATNPVTAVQAGRYVAWFAVSIATGSTGVYALVVNNAVVANTNASAENIATSGAHELVGFAVINLTANATVGIRNIGNLADTLAPGTDGQTPTRVMLTFMRVS